MKNFLLFFVVLLPQILFTQSLIYNENFESSGYNWDGVSTIGTHSSLINGTTNSGTDRPQNSNKFLSSSNGFTQWGLGIASSSWETEIYQLPNITGLDVTNTYILSLNLMAYAQNYGGFIGSGLDVSDYIEVRVSTNGGLTYVTESRITGFDNSFWSFNSNGVINEVANNTLNTYSPTVGGNQESSGKGYSKYNLILNNINQLSVRIFMRANYGGVGYGEWWIIDDINLYFMSPTSLPVELTYFDGVKQDGFNLLKWQTASEHNSSHFIVEKTTTGDFDNSSVIGNLMGSGNSQEIIDYDLLDMKVENTINYYRLIQYDFDGEYKVYPIIAIDNRIQKDIDKIVDLSGKEVDENYKGFVIIYYKNGEFVKTYQF
jgi:hypothetical protein